MWVANLKMESCIVNNVFKLLTCVMKMDIQMKLFRKLCDYYFHYRCLNETMIITMEKYI